MVLRARSDVRRRFSPPLPNGAYAKVLDGIFKRIDFRDVRGGRRSLSANPGFSCGKDPTEVCEVVKSWNGSTLWTWPAPATSSNGQKSRMQNRSV